MSCSSPWYSLRTIIHNHTQSYTIIHNPTQSYTIIHNHTQSYIIRTSVTTDCDKTYVHPCKVEFQKIIHFMLNIITSNILTINTSPVSLKVFNANKRIRMEKANECTVINTIPCWPDDGRVTAETCSRM